MGAIWIEGAFLFPGEVNKTVDMSLLIEHPG